MYIARWNPWGGLENFHEDAKVAARRANAAQPDILPTTDIHETAEAFELSLDLPGVKLEDIQIEVADRVLKITGERRVEQRTEQPGYKRLERAFGRFARTFRLGNDIDEQAIVAKMIQTPSEIIERARDTMAQ